MYHPKRLKFLLLLLCSSLFFLGAQAQNTAAPEAASPSTLLAGEYKLGGVVISGANYLDKDLLLAVAGFTVGQRITLPFDQSIANAIRNLWKQELFADVAIQVEKIVGENIFLEIVVEERPRLSRYNFKGIKKSEANELKDKVGLVRSRVVTDATKAEAINRIAAYYKDKGFSQAKVAVAETPDTLGINTILLTFTIDKGAKTKINYISFADNEVENDLKLKRKMKGTKEMTRLTLHSVKSPNVFEKSTLNHKDYYWNNLYFLNPSMTLDKVNPYFNLTLFSSSKFDRKKFEEDKNSLINHYNSLGYRDAAIIDDSVYRVASGNLNVDMKVYEGRRYYFGSIDWRGNTKYSSDSLGKILGIKRGDVYNIQLLNSRLGLAQNPEGTLDVTSLYMDDGYLFFSVTPIETAIIGDTIHYEMRIVEGPQATIKNIHIAGNDRTNEHVIRREIRTLPGNKFSRSDVTRTYREIANLGFFNQEKISIVPKPNQTDGTVDIEYGVEEKSSDQLQLSAGFGGQFSFYGNIGMTFNNFSLRNMLNPKTWDPLPMGDGQKLNLNYSSNGLTYNSLNASFTEPWLGGKKPTALTLSFTNAKFKSTGITGSYERDTLNAHFIRITGGGLNLSNRLKWPDDNFILSVGLNYNYIQLKDYPGFLAAFTDGFSNNLYTKISIARYTIDQPLYPRSGSNFNLTLQLTPPYSLLNNQDYSQKTTAQKYKFIEYHKYRFTGEWYQRVAGNLVLKFAAKYGYMGYYNKDIGYSPFERFQVGGDGLSGFGNFLIGRDIIAHRGYDIYEENAIIFNKYQLELRYPLSLAPTSTIYALTFIDAANAWNSYRNYNPFQLNRSAGVGVRVFLPMFGLLGLDYGIGFDKYNKATGDTKLKSLAKFTFMLGQEPD